MKVEPILKKITLAQWIRALKYRPVQPEKISAIDGLDKFAFLRLLKNAKEIPREYSDQKLFIFGAGGTTSWILPKLLKIYNDLLHKRSHNFKVEIILVDGDIV